jgi:hypothetical protein
MKEIVLKLTELLDKSNDLDNAVMDLYRLYHILHPEDFTLDSRMLDFVMKEGGPRGPVTENRKHKTDS